MPAISTNDLKNGMTLELDNGLFTVVEFQHVKPGKGGAFVRTTLKNARTGAVLDRTFRAGEKVEQAILDKRDMQFLYRDGDDYVFMDTQTYDQLNVAPTALGDAADFLVENATAILAMFGDEIVGGRAARLGRAHRHRDRARRAGRPRVGRPQAGHARDRQGRPGAAVRERRATGSRSTPAPATTSPGSDAANEDLPLARPGSGRWRCSTRPTPRAPRPPRSLAALPVDPDPFAVLLVEGVDAAPGRASTACSPPRPGLDARAHAGRSTAPSARSARSSCWTGPTCRPAVVLDEAVELAKRYSHRRLGPLRQRRSCRPIAEKVR